jgi:hypothetical protein
MIRAVQPMGPAISAGYRGSKPELQQPPGIAGLPALYGTA